MREASGERYQALLREKHVVPTAKMLDRLAYMYSREVSSVYTKIPANRSVPRQLELLVSNLPIRPEICVKVSEFVFKVLTEYMRKTETLYRGVSFLREEELREYLRGDGRSIRPCKNQSAIPLTVFESVARKFTWTALRGDAIIEINVPDVHVEMVNFQLEPRGGDPLHMDLMPCRNEGEVRVREIPLYSINNVKLLRS